MPAMVEARRSDQPAGITLAGLGVPPPGRHHRNERLVARPRRPPHVRTPIGRWTLQRLHARRRSPLETCPTALRGTTLRVVLNELPAKARSDHAGCPQLGSIQVIHGWKSGAIRKAPSAAVAVDNPLGLSPSVGRGTKCSGNLSVQPFGMCLKITKYIHENCRKP